MAAADDKQKKADFDLHILLIMRQEGITKAKAQFRAWLEGEQGLAARLGQKSLPLDQKEATK